MHRIARVDWARLADFVIAFGLLAPALTEVWIAPFFTDHVSGPRWLNTIFLAGISVPMLWRRTKPEAAFLVFAASWTVYPLVLYPSQIDQPGETWFAMLLAWFSFGLYGCGRRAAVAGLIGGLGFLAVMASMLNAGVTPSEVLPNWIFPLGAWLLGRLLRRRDLLAGRLRKRADDLEARRAEEAARAATLERARIARELHDMISHSVSVMVMQASVERRLLGDIEPRYSHTLLEIERAGRNALDELRTLLGVLRESGDAAELQPQPTLAQLPALVERVRGAGLSVGLRIKGEAIDLPAAIELSAYRIVQEGLTNVLKHAGNASAEVTVQYERDRLGLEVRDDGAGANGQPPGSGLAGLRERVAVYGGTIDAFSPEGGGFVIRASLPASIGTT